jgi:threonine/homoserine/homoserine lactone efflux protein
MKVVLKFVAGLFVAIGVFLIYAVVHAAASAGGARVGVAVAYVAGALVLGFLAVTMWRRSVPRSS